MHENSERRYLLSKWHVTVLLRRSRQLRKSPSYQHRPLIASDLKFRPWAFTVNWWESAARVYGARCCVCRGPIGEMLRYPTSDRTLLLCETHWRSFRAVRFRKPSADLAFADWLGRKATSIAKDSSLLWHGGSVATTRELDRRYLAHRMRRLCHRRWSPFAPPSDMEAWDWTRHNITLINRRLAHLRVGITGFGRAPWGCWFDVRCPFGPPVQAFERVLQSCRRRSHAPHCRVSVRPSGALASTPIEFDDHNLVNWEDQARRYRSRLSLLKI